ncbi:unnamed protein product [Ectocarpus sp. 12 AP-2014]
MKQRAVPTLCSSSIRGSEGSKKRVAPRASNTFINTKGNLNRLSERSGAHRRDGQRQTSPTSPPCTRTRGAGQALLLALSRLQPQHAQPSGCIHRSYFDKSSQRTPCQVDLDSCTRTFAAPDDGRATQPRLWSDQQ